MPTLAHIGAFTARPRAAQLKSSLFPFSAPERVPVARKTSETSDSDTASNCSLDSKASVLSWLIKGKQQVQEAGDILRKKQQSLLEKVQSGLLAASSTATGQKMVSGPSTAQSNRTSLKDSEPKVDVVKLSAADPGVAKIGRWIDRLEQMGFKRPDIQEAMTKLGKKAEMEELVQVLVNMEASSFEAFSSGGSSSSDEFPVSVKRWPGDSLGISVDVLASMLRIEKLECGLVSRWNAANTCVQVKVGDYIIEVNGTRGSGQALWDLLMHTPSVTMAIKAMVAGAPVINAAPCVRSLVGNSAPIAEARSLVMVAPVMEEEPAEDAISETSSEGDTAVIEEVEDADQESIADFAAQMVESAFTRAAQVVEEEAAQRRLAAKQEFLDSLRQVVATSRPTGKDESMSSKHMLKPCSRGCASTVRGGA